MVRARLVVMAVAIASAGLADASGAVTPDGRATMFTDWHGSFASAQDAPGVVLTGVRIRVGAGGRAGRIWVRVVNGDKVRVHGPFALPSTPGTYTLAVPHEHWE